MYLLSVFLVSRRNRRRKRERRKATIINVGRNLRGSDCIWKRSEVKIGIGSAAKCSQWRKKEPWRLGTILRCQTNFWSSKIECLDADTQSGDCIRCSSEKCIRGIGTALPRRRQPASEDPSESLVPGSAPPAQDKAAPLSKPRPDIRIAC